MSDKQAPARLPNAERAILDLAKVRDYCLNPCHPEGRHKARVFKTALGAWAGNAKWVRAAPLSEIQSAPLRELEATP
jgi:hypothetical protein